jgi:hypothetical protein
MNFLDLYKKIQSLDKPVTENTHVVHHYPNGQDDSSVENNDIDNTGVEEDGVEMGASMAPPSAPAMPTDGEIAMPAEEDMLEPTATDIAPDQHTGDPVIQGEESEEESIMMMPAPMDMPMPHTPEKQADSVSMNVSMNGSGTGGIRDLMSVLRNIENGVEPANEPHHDDTMVIGEPDDMGEELPVAEKFGNSVHGDRGAHVMGLNAIIRNGNDMHSKGDNEPMKKAGGGNPYTESLVNKLTAMYEEIKGEPIEEAKKTKPDFLDVDKDSHQEKTTMKHVKNPTDAEKKAAKDIKPGIAGYKDRVDMLKSAEKDGRLDESVSQMLALNKRLNG